jgi:hypothetical protein
MTDFASSLFAFLEALDNDAVVQRSHVHALFSVAQQLERLRTTNVKGSTRGYPSPCVSASREPRRNRAVRHATAFIDRRLGNRWSCDTQPFEQCFGEGRQPG